MPLMTLMVESAKSKDLMLLLVLLPHTHKNTSQFLVHSSIKLWLLACLHSSFFSHQMNATKSPKVLNQQLLVLDCGVSFPNGLLTVVLHWTRLVIWLRVWCPWWLGMAGKFSGKIFLEFIFILKEVLKFLESGQKLKTILMIQKLFWD